MKHLLSPLVFLLFILLNLCCNAQTLFEPERVSIDPMRKEMSSLLNRYKQDQTGMLNEVIRICLQLEKLDLDPVQKEYVHELKNTAQLFLADTNQTDASGTLNHLLSIRTYTSRQLEKYQAGFSTYKNKLDSTFLEVKQLENGAFVGENKEKFIENFEAYLKAVKKEKVYDNQNFNFVIDVNTYPDSIKYEKNLSILVKIVERQYAINDFCLLMLRDYQMNNAAVSPLLIGHLNTIWYDLLSKSLIDNILLLNRSVTQHYQLHCHDFYLQGNHLQGFEYGWNLPKEWNKQIIEYFNNYNSIDSKAYMMSLPNSEIYDFYFTSSASTELKRETMLSYKKSIIAGKPIVEQQILQVRYYTAKRQMKNVSRHKIFMKDRLLNDVFVVVKADDEYYLITLCDVGTYDHKLKVLGSLSVEKISDPDLTIKNIEARNSLLSIPYFPFAKRETTNGKCVNFALSDGTELYVLIPAIVVEGDMNKEMQRYSGIQKSIVENQQKSKRAK